jgi:hypothetical protein
LSVSISTFSKPGAILEKGVAIITFILLSYIIILKVKDKEV